MFSYPLLPILSLIGFFLLSSQFPSHLRARQSATCLYMMWAMLVCLNQGVNLIVWRRDAINYAPVWCDISIRVWIGANVGIPASALCIVRRLHKVTTLKAPMTAAQKRRDIFIDLMIGLLLPCLYIALSWFVLGHRFNIYEGVGCWPAIYISVPTYFLYLLWPTVTGIISAGFCLCALRNVYKMRSEFLKMLPSKTDMDQSQYIRLMTLAMTEVVFTVPLSIVDWAYPIHMNTLRPYTSLADVHLDYGRMVQTPAILWQQDSAWTPTFLLSLSGPILCAFVFFAFFGLTSEAKTRYRHAYCFILQLFGRKEDTSKITPVSHMSFVRPALHDTFESHSAETLAAIPELKAQILANDNLGGRIYTNEASERVDPADVSFHSARASVELDAANLA